MNCRIAEELMQKSLDAPLTPSERARLDAHRETCPDCRSAWSECRRLSRTASEWTRRASPDEMPPAEFAAQVMSRVAARPEPNLLRSRVLAACAALVLLAALSPLAAPWLPPAPHWEWAAWPSQGSDALWTVAEGAPAARWAEALLAPALVANALLLLRARRAA